MAFFRERLLAAGFVGCVGLFGFGLMLLDSGRRVGMSAAERDAQWQAYQDRAAFGVTLMGISMVAAVVLLAIGLMLAFGFGPSFLARRVKGAKVEERLVLGPDGNTFLGQCPDDHDDARFYLRVRYPDGRVEELLCPPEWYRRAKIGDVVNLRVLGCRIVELGRS